MVAHGGPTAQSYAALDLRHAYFTSRGFNVVEVNYGGSTGYGRAYRESLRGQWGIVDTQDVLAVVNALIADGTADRRKVLISGSSAGGFTALNCLLASDLFAAGASHFGVVDLVPLAEETHDFESRYLDSLIGPYPDRRDLYVSRSPLSHADALNTPVILFHGTDDAVVPVAGARDLHRVCHEKGLMHEYHEFPGEGHGFSRAETIEVALRLEFGFFAKVLGINPA
jgi:dipeptidyl aminopeptidase/acylaminoacyl peptidase